MVNIGRQEMIGILTEHNRLKQLKFEQDIIKILMPRYNISNNSNDCWKQLALKLVLRYQPVFKGGQPGAGKQWHVNRQIELLKDIDQLQKEEKLSIAKACDKLVKTEKWRGRTGDALRKRYWIIKKELKKYSPVIEKYHSKNNSGN